MTYADRGGPIRSVLVAYSSKYGSTRGIAEYLAGEFVQRGIQAWALPAKAIDDLARYDAVVLGSAVFAGRWRPDAKAFVLRLRSELIERPVWLFSSGPLGDEKTDAAGRDLAAASAPLDQANLLELTQARGSTVFFGALETAKLDLGGRLVRRIPAARAVMPDGDFRDWAVIEAWAATIADELTAAS